MDLIALKEVCEIENGKSLELRIILKNIPIKTYYIQETYKYNSM